MSKEYKLVALDDYIKVEKNKIQKLEQSGKLLECLPGGNKVISIGELLSGKRKYDWWWARVEGQTTWDDFYKTGRCKDVVGYFEHGKDIDYSLLGKIPEHISTAYGGVTTDLVGNTIVIGCSRWNPLFKTFLEAGIYGDKIYTATFSGSRVEHIDKLMNGYLDQDLKKAFPDFYNKRKATQPLVYNWTFDNRLFKITKDAASTWSTVLNVVAAAVSLIPGIGTATATGIAALSAALGTALKEYAATNKTSFATNKALIESGTRLLGVNTEQGIVKDGVDIYNAFNNLTPENADFIASKLGVQFDKEKVNTAFNTYAQINQILKNQSYDGIDSNPKIKYNIYKQKIQAFQDAQTFGQLTYSIDQALDIIEKEVSLKPVGGEFLKRLIQIAVGRNNGTNYLNYSAVNVIGKLNTLSNILNQNEFFRSPEGFKFLMDVTTGGKIDNNVMNYLFLNQIEEQIRNSKSKNIYLPYAIETEKAICIAKELNTNGYNIYFDGGMLENNNSSILVTKDVKRIASKYNYYLKVV